MKCRDELVIALAWALLYIPYIIQGGWVRDDLALLTSTRGVQLYAQFQWFISANRDMTARPVSAIIHGLSYWLLGYQAWPYHLLNLALFGASVLLFYLAIKKLISRDVALVAALFALVYPCASTTVFSSIMMNSNLAAFFWSGGLYVASGNFRWKQLLSTGLFIMSALSYEAFIPLLAFGTLVNLFVFKLHRSDRKRLMVEALPMLVAVGAYGLYRGLLEKAIFHTSFSRVVISSPAAVVGKFLSSLVAGLKIAVVDSIALSIRGVGNLRFVPAAYIAAILLGLILVGIYLYKAGHPAEKDHAAGERLSYPGLIGLAACLFCVAHLIYAFSNYVPESIAFNNRTLGGMRFATGFAMAALIVPIGRGLIGRQAARSATVFLIGLFSLFTFSTVGQSQAWVLAGRRNEQMASDITAAIQSSRIDPAKLLTLVAVLPDDFPGQINQEPVLGVPWDITPLLLLHNPDLAINADVYNPSAVAGPEGVIIQNYDHTWQGTYPLWLYSSASERLYRVAAQQDWNMYLEMAVPAASP